MVKEEGQGPPWVEVEGGGVVKLRRWRTGAEEIYLYSPAGCVLQSCGPASGWRCSPGQ